MNVNHIERFNEYCLYELTKRSNIYVQTHICVSVHVCIKQPKHTMVIPFEADWAVPAWYRLCGNAREWNSEHRIWWAPGEAKVWPCLFTAGLVLTCVSHTHSSLQFHTQQTQVRGVRIFQTCWVPFHCLPLGVTTLLTLFSPVSELYIMTLDFHQQWLFAYDHP